MEVINYIKKDINKILLLLIIIFFLLFAWHTAYYESTLKNISMQHNEEIKKLQQSTGKVVLEKSNETIQLRENYQKDKEFFEQRYYDLSTENEELKGEKERLQSELNSIKSELENIKAKFDILLVRFQEVESSLVKSNEQISSLISRNRELCDKLKSSGGSDDKC